MKTKVATFASIAANRGPTLLYRKGHSNQCPYCHGNQWLLGNTGAQCAYENCGMVLEYDNPPTSGVGTIFRHDYHIAEKRGSTRGGETFLCQDFHTPERRVVA